MRLHLYSIRCAVNGKQYIGQTNDPEQRWYAHLSYLRRGKHHSATLQRSFHKYGEKAFSFSIIGGPFETQEIANAEEIRRIAEENTMAPHGYNHRTGGFSSPMSESAKEKLSISRKAFFAAGGNVAFKGKRHTTETKEIIRHKARERFKDPKEREKASANGYLSWTGEFRDRTMTANRSAHQTERYRRHNSLKHRSGEPFPDVIDPNGIRYSVRISLADFCREHKLERSAMSMVLNGLRPHHKGWRTAS